MKVTHEAPIEDGMVMNDGAVVKIRHHVRKIKIDVIVDGDYKDCLEYEIPVETVLVEKSGTVKQ